MKPEDAHAILNCINSERGLGAVLKRLGNGGSAITTSTSDAVNVARNDLVRRRTLGLKGATQCSDRRKAMAR